MQWEEGSLTLLASQRGYKIPSLGHLLQSTTDFQRVRTSITESVSSDDDFCTKRELCDADLGRYFHNLSTKHEND